MFSTPHKHVADKNDTPKDVDCSADTAQRAPQQIRIATMLEITEAERSAWTAYASAPGAFASAFLHPTFADALASVRSDVRVAVVTEDAEPVAFLPFHQRRFETATALGLGVSDAQGMVVRPNTTVCAPEIVHAAHLGMLEFDHWVPAEVAPSRLWRAVPAAVMDLSDGFEGYLAQENRKSRRLVKSLMQKRRKLEREVGEISIEFDCRDVTMLKRLMELKSAQYRRTGRSDRFAVPWIRSLLNELFIHRSDDVRGVLSVVRAGDTPIAYHFGLQAGEWLSLWFPVYEEAYGKYSPGLLQFLELARVANDNGVAYLDLNRGEEEFKQQLKSFDRFVGEGWFATVSVGAFMRQLRIRPRRAVTDFVLGHQRIRLRARKTLQVLGQARERATHRP